MLTQRWFQRFTLGIGEEESSWRGKIGWGIGVGPVTDRDTFKIPHFKAITLSFHGHLPLPYLPSPWIPAYAGMTKIITSISATLFFFDFFYLVYPGYVPAALEIGAEKILNDNLSLSPALLRRQTTDLSIIMQSGPVSRKNIIALGRPYPPHFIGGNAHADAGAAYQYAPVKLAPDDGLGYLHGDIRIVNRIFGIAPEVMRTVPRLSDYFYYKLLESTTPVVIADSNTHGCDLLHKVTPLSRDFETTSTFLELPAS
jgi:hypothetical protein